MNRKQLKDFGNRYNKLVRSSRYTKGTILKILSQDFNITVDNAREILRKLLDRKEIEELAVKKVLPNKIYRLPNGKKIKIVRLQSNKRGTGLSAEVVDAQTGQPIFGKGYNNIRPSIIPLSAIKENKMSKNLSVFDKHRKKIAIRTLKMNDVGASIMGGMSKNDARAFLKKMGYSDKQIKKLEEQRMKIKESVLRQMIKNVIKEESEYQIFFRKILKKFGVDSPDQLSDERKKEFFNYIDSHWDAGSNETDMDEIFEFPEFSKKNPTQRVKAQKRNRILKVSESFVRRMIREELSFLMFSDVPGGKGRKRAKRNKSLFGDSTLP